LKFSNHYQIGERKGQCQSATHTKVNLGKTRFGNFNLLLHRRKPPLMRSGMARVRGITQFYLPPTRLSTNWMNHPAILPSGESRCDTQGFQTNDIVTRYSAAKIRRKCDEV